RRLLHRYDQAGNVDRAIALLEPVVATTPSDQAALVSLAEGYFRRWEIKKDEASIARAKETARAALSLNEQDAPTHVVWATIDYVQGLLDGAVSEAQRAIALNGQKSEAWRELGRAYFRLSRMDEAEKALRNAVKFGPDDWTAHNALGALYYQGNRLEDAAAEFQQMLDSAPNNVKAYNNLGSAMLVLERFAEARGYYERSVQIEQNPTAYSNLGTTYYNDGRYGDAAEQHEKATRQPNATSEHWSYLGAARYWAPDLHDQAKVAYETALQYGARERQDRPRDTSLLLRMAESHAVLGLLTDGSTAEQHKSEARKLVAAVEQQPPQRLDDLLTLATTFEELDNRPKALEWLQKAVKAGLPLTKVERSPWLKELRSDEAYLRLFKK